MPTKSTVISYGRDQTFVHDQEIANFTLNNGDSVVLTANHGGFLLQMREKSPSAAVLESYHLGNFHEAMLATRQMAQEHGGAPVSPKLEDHEAGEELHTESVNGYDLVLERSEDEADLCWDVYATDTASGKTGDVQSFEPDQYLLALNAYDELYFELESADSRAG